MPDQIYLDYNATTPIDKEVADEMVPFIYEHFGNPSSGYEYGQKTKEAVQNAREQVATLIGAKANEIIFTSGGTESNNMAIRGIAFENQQKGKHIITSAIEHPAVIEVCKYLETLGWKTTYVPVDKEGVVRIKDLEKALRKDTTLITVMHANNEVGSIQPIAEIAALAEEKNIAFHTDAAQSLGKIKVDVNELSVDVLSIAGHKIYAPKGIGALYLRNETKIEKLIYGAGQENDLRAGTENVASIVALGKACEIAKRDFTKNTENMLVCKTRLLEGLQKNFASAIKLNGHVNKTLPNTLSMAFLGIQAHELAAAVKNQLCISTGSACHNTSTEVSAVLKAMQVNPLVGQGTVRISTGKHTTIKDIDSAIEIISKAAEMFT